MLTVEVASDEHVQARTDAAAGLLGELQRNPFGRDDIVAADDALFFDVEVCSRSTPRVGTKAEADPPARGRTWH